MSYPVGTHLQINPGTTSGGVAPLVTTYQWELDGTPIGGATSADYTTIAAGQLTCVQTVTDDTLAAITAETTAETIVAVDVTDPTISGAFSPVDGGTDIAINTNLVATFSENVSLVTGGTITIKNLTDVSQVVITVPDAQASITGDTLTINPTSDLTAGKAYAIQISADCVKDASDNFFAGILNDTTWNFGTAAAGFDWTNLEAYWPMDEASGTRADAVGAIDLTEVGGTINSGTGIVHATAADFELANADMLRNQSDATVLHDGGPFTVIMWIKPESLTTDAGVISTENTNTFGSYFYSPTQIRWIVVNTIMTVTHGMTAGNWYMLAMGYDPTADTQFVSINGAAKSVAANTETRSSVAASIILGRYGPTAPEYYDGLMGPVMWFSESMDIARIQDIYAGGSGVAYP